MAKQTTDQRLDAIERKLDLILLDLEALRARLSGKPTERVDPRPLPEEEPPWPEA